MKKMVGMFVVATLGAIAFGTTTANADGGPSRGRVVAEPLYAVPYNWSGFYIGVHGGFATADVDWTVNEPLPGSIGTLAAKGTKVGNELNDWLWGGHVGFNLQKGRWVFGIEGAWSKMEAEDKSIDANAVVPVQGGTFFEKDTFATKIDNLVMVTGRVGYAWDNWLGYVKAGWARAEIETSFRLEFVAFPVMAVADLRASTEEKHDGWTMGVGVETQINRNVIFGIEYNYIALGSERHRGRVTNADGSPTAFVFDVNVDPDPIHSVMGRLSFKFGAREPERVVPLK
jgi:outer membrane immunogenic protein